jgi:hypothetical protein
MNYYLDIETTGLDPLHCKIITIQYMELDRNTAKPIGSLKILKEWESDEKTILKRFIEDFVPERQWAFIPIGFNLQFEHKFLWQRCISNGLQPVDILNGPFLDLKTVAVLMNKGEFKGASLHQMTNKPHSGAIVVEWYGEKKYAEIERYIKTEADEFSNFCVRLYKEMPPLLEMIEDGNVNVYKKRTTT